MVTIENLDFDELEGASITEKRRAVNLAYPRYSWLRDKQYLKECTAVVLTAVGIASVLIYVLPDSDWMLPVVALVAISINYRLRPSESQRIRPLLPQALKDVRQHAYM